MENDVLQRINSIIEKENMSVRSFANRIGVPQTTLNNYIIGKRSLSFDLIDKILISFEYISSEWLLRGSGNMIRDDTSTNNLDLSAESITRIMKVIQGNNEKLIERSEIVELNDEGEVEIPTSSIIDFLKTQNGMMFAIIKEMKNRLDSTRIDLDKMSSSIDAFVKSGINEFSA